MKKKNARGNSRALFQKCCITSACNGTEDDTTWKNMDSDISEKKSDSEEWILEYEDSLGIPSICFTYIYVHRRVRNIYTVR